MEGEGKNQRKGDCVRGELLAGSKTNILMKAIAWTGNQNHRFSLTIYRASITSPIPVYVRDLGLIVVPPPQLASQKPIWREGEETCALALAPLSMRERKKGRGNRVNGRRMKKTHAKCTVCSTLRSPHAASCQIHIFDVEVKRIQFGVSTRSSGDQLIIHLNPEGGDDDKGV